MPGAALMADAQTADDLGVRAELLVDKHAAYIRSFSKLWEVRACG